jgi:hypothetical protein
VWQLLGVEQIQNGCHCHGNDSDFLAYLVPLDVVVTGNITAKICEVWSEFNIFCTVVLLRVDFFKMAAVAMEMAKMRKIRKTQK